MYYYNFLHIVHWRVLCGNKRKTLFVASLWKPLFLKCWNIFLRVSLLQIHFHIHAFISKHFPVVISLQSLWQHILPTHLTFVLTLLSLPSHNKIFWTPISGAYIYILNWQMNLLRVLITPSGLFCSHDQLTEVVNDAFRITSTTSDF